MKRILAIIGLILMNAGLIYLSLWLHYGQTEKMIRTTDTPNEIESMFFIPILLGGLVFFFVNRKFRFYGIGLTAICISSALFLFIYTNKRLAAKGNYENFKLRNAGWTDNNFYLDIEFNMWYNSTQVTQENCLNVDSVQVRIDNGLFGMRTMTNDVRIVESEICTHDDLDSTNIVKSHLEIGHELSQKRCFSAAIDHYSNCIESDSLNPHNYYHRGLMFMAKKHYDKALVDFMISAFIQYNGSDKKTIQQIDNIKLLAYSKELLIKLDKKEFNNIGAYINNIKTIDDFDTYQKRITFCMGKLNE